MFALYVVRTKFSRLLLLGKMEELRVVKQARRNTYDPLGPVGPEEPVTQEPERKLFRSKSLAKEGPSQADAKWADQSKD